MQKLLKKEKVNVLDQYYEVISFIYINIFCFVGKTHSQSVEEKFQLLPLGAIKPEGWLKTQMEQDMQGFVGHLDSLVPTLIYDPIYSSGRIHKNSKSADLGNLKSGDAVAMNNTNGGIVKHKVTGGMDTLDMPFY